MRSEENHLFFEGTLGGDPLAATAALHNLISKQGYRDVTLDFRKARRLFPEYMIPLVTDVRSYRHKKVDVDLLLPEDPKASAHLSNTNWAHLMCPEHFDPKDTKNVKHMSARQYFTAEEHYSAVDDCLSIILACVPGIDRNRLKALEWALNEVTDNVLNHASSPVGGIVQIFTLPQKGRVEFYVCDAGITIPKSLRAGRPDIQDDTSALRRAIDEGVTSNTSTNQGNGLFGTFKCCEVSGGEFDVRSGSVSLRHRPGQLSVSRSPIPFGGTYVRASIGYEYERLLEKALVFKGRSHDPGHDFIERKYETDEDRIEFAVASELRAFGSRDAGKLARNKIENLMDRQSRPIDFNFSEIRLISSSFADEVFGKLFAELGPIRFNQLCRFTNIDPTVRGLIDRAIMQRMKVI